jgi:hypothetical protein
VLSTTLPSANTGHGSPARRNPWQRHGSYFFRPAGGLTIARVDCHRQATWPARLLLSIIRLAGQAPSRRQPLSSNVRPHVNRRMTNRASGYRRQEQRQSRARPRSSMRSLSAMRSRTWSADVTASLKQTDISPNMNHCAGWLYASHCSGRPSAGGRLTVGCPRKKNAEALSRSAATHWSMRATPVAARSNRAPGQRSCASPAWHRGPKCKVRPNPSLERTATGMAPWPRARAVYHRPRGQGATPASAAQLKR